MHRKHEIKFLLTSKSKGRFPWEAANDQICLLRCQLQGHVRCQLQVPWYLRYGQNLWFIARSECSSKIWDSQTPLWFCMVLQSSVKSWLFDLFFWERLIVLHGFGWFCKHLCWMITSRLLWLHESFEMCFQSTSWVYSKPVSAGSLACMGAGRMAACLQVVTNLGHQRHICQKSMNKNQTNLLSLLFCSALGVTSPFTVSRGWEIIGHGQNRIISQHCTGNLWHQRWKLKPTQTIMEMVANSTGVPWRLTMWISDLRLLTNSNTT